jgi:hypothetical protein
VATPSDAPPSQVPPESPQPGRPRRGHRKPKRRRWWLRILLGFFLLVILAGAGGAYVVYRAYKEVRAISIPMETIRLNLAKARASLAHGKVPVGDPLAEAAAATATVRARIAHAGSAYRWVAKAPVLGRPMAALQLELDAANSWAHAAGTARDIVADLLGPKALRGTPGALTGPAPVMRDNVVNLKLISTLPARLQTLIGDLETAGRAIAAIRDVPFYRRLGKVKASALAENASDLALARTALDTARLLPSFLGARGPKRYFFALLNNSDLRATGGAVLGYAFVVADHGRMTMVESGRVHELDDKYGGVHTSVPGPVYWYIQHAHVQPRLANGANYSPNLPVVGKAWYNQLRAITGREFAGAIAIDPVAVAHVLGKRQFDIPTWPVPINGSNLVSVVERGQYDIPKPLQMVLPDELIKNAWPVISKARPFVRTVQALAQMLREKHIQLWAADPKQEALLQSLHWAGQLTPGRGDYFYAVDNKRVANKVDYYSHSAIDYRATLTPKGAAVSTFQFTLTNQTPPNENYHVRGSHLDPYALNRAMISLYLPLRARFESVQPATVAFNPRLSHYAPTGFVEHIEENLRVLIQTIDAWPSHPGVLTFHYVVPGAVRPTPGGGHVYELTVQHQPLLHPAGLTVTVMLPKGAKVTSAPGWKVAGRVATLHTTLTRDFVTRIYF